MATPVACAARAPGVASALPPSSHRAATHAGASTRAPGVASAPRARPRSRRFAVADGDRGASPPAPPSSSSWHRLSARWEADEDTAMEGELLDLLSPAWRIMLLSDGSVTRHLRLLCPKLDCTALELVAQGPIGTFAGAGGAAAMPADVERIEGDLVQREVLLRIRGPERDDGTLPGWSDRGGSALTATPLTAANDGTVPAVYAASWWSSDTFAEFMSDSASPMWSNLRSANVELYREVRRVYQGDNKALEEVFGTTGPFWGRHYIFWHAGKPMTVVYEVFNPRLENALGPAKPP